ncbi:MAG: DNA alkylation repair protein [candidate division FCPU426 bacterium]
MPVSLTAALADIRQLADPVKAKFLSRFFKTGPGEYAEGDRFLGITVPQLRRLAKKYAILPLADIERLIQSPDHETRLLGLLLVVGRYPRASEADRESLFRCYVRNARHINNWDLVDVTAPHVLGAHLEHRDRGLLEEWAGSPNLWKRRLSLLATLRFIRKGDFSLTLRLVDRLLQDPEDLMHKAAGWMLREVGKKDRARLEAFLRPRYQRMPRTMLRYAIERFPAQRRQAYLKSRI